jgi:hypothetical protein
MRLRLLIEVNADDFVCSEVARAIESHKVVCVEMPGWGSAVHGLIVGAIPVDEEVQA